MPDPTSSGNALFTLIGTLGGATLGLGAPMLTSTFGRRDRGKDAQREIAKQILDLFREATPLSTALATPNSQIRRQLYILTLQLRNKEARVACMTMVSLAGGDNATDAGLAAAWSRMMELVGEVYRG